MLFLAMGVLIFSSLCYFAEKVSSPFFSSSTFPSSSSLFSSSNPSLKIRPSGLFLSRLLATPSSSFSNPQHSHHHLKSSDTNPHHHHHDHSQGGRTWQPFVGSKNGNENFRQARIYNFRVKCVVFARNRKFAKLTQ